ncbi:MAG: hypothetical protein R3F65_30215 [bacterium]
MDMKDDQDASDAAERAFHARGLPAEGAAIRARRTAAAAIFGIDAGRERRG